MPVLGELAELIGPHIAATCETAVLHSDKVTYVSRNRLRGSVEDYDDDYILKLKYYIEWDKSTLPPATITH